MRDSDTCIRVLSRNTNGELTSLQKLVDYIQAEEAGKNESQDLITEDYQVSGLRRNSNYQRDKNKCTGCLKKNALFRKSLIVILPQHKKHNDCIFLLTQQVNNTKYIVILSKENYFFPFSCFMAAANCVNTLKQDG